MELKFRAWIKRCDIGLFKNGMPSTVIRNQMLPVTGLHFFEGQELSSVSLDSEEFGEIQDIPLYGHDISITVLQWTGLKDKNGVDIYEKDIITGKDGNFIIKGIIKFREGCYWCMIPPDDYFEMFPDLMECYEVTVIGNIYEDGGLLK